MVSSVIILDGKVRVNFHFSRFAVILLLYQNPKYRLSLFFRGPGCKLSFIIVLIVQGAVLFHGTSASTYFKVVEIIAT